MIIIYNIAQILLIILVWPLIALTIAVRPRHWGHILKRLGWGLCPDRRKEPGKKTVWVHALSVGEVTSSLPLVAGIRKDLDVELVFSATTRTGTRMAAEIIAPHVDRLIPYPIDIIFVILHFIRIIRPDLFILVETDFWPNQLAALQRKKIPTLLVNGRISGKSMDSYRRFGFFFRPLFNSFSALGMQTAEDGRRLTAMGIDAGKIVNLGNLKFDSQPSSVIESGGNWPSAIRILAGSTHRGEEEMLMLAYGELKKAGRNLSLVIAPRDIARSPEVVRLATSLGLETSCRSQGWPDHQPDLLILDTIGELAACYRTCDIAFTGGSLVDEGGHNPLEPAVAGVPVLFGPHMEDFAEVASEMIAAGGAIRVADADALFHSLERLVDDSALRQATGQAAAAYVRGKQGVVGNHLDLIRKYL
ncbi:MAG: 3-deoxy-D-manno-octulosonic acid transferase [Desulfocapsaceae bacterium]|nr:3-deoxy-D-manno-octulosonic acid transferase [Desulfocapsaceae bacterium]